MVAASVVKCLNPSVFLFGSLPPLGTYNSFFDQNVVIFSHFIFHWPYVDFKFSFVEFFIPFENNSNPYLKSSFPKQASVTKMRLLFFLNSRGFALNILFTLSLFFV